MAPNGKICQSCTMPMQKPEDFGTEADGSRSEDYCKYCYKDGKFTWPDATIGQMTEKLVSMAGVMGMGPDQVRSIAERTLPTLKRWKKLR